MTGNFYCVPSSCAKVVYREYLPPVVRYRYEGEDWQEIEGDDYAIEQESNGGQCEGTYYLRASCSIELWTWTNFSFRSLGVVYPSVDTRSTGAQIVGPVTSVEFISSPPCPKKDSNQTTCTYGGRVMYAVVNDALGQKLLRALLWTDAPFEGGVLSLSKTNFLRRDTIANENYEFELTSGEPDLCGENCNFTVFFDGVVVHEETRAKCPEVEQFDCRLSDEIKQIKIQKLPFLERVEVRNQDISTFFLPPLDTPFTEVNSLPEHSLNIYRTVVTAPPFLQETVPLPGAVNPYVFIAQISSAPGCPPPEYTVICDGDSCESCPEGTCPVECDGQICCYDTTTGIAVKSIPIDEYCGG
ncbi:MAG: hypothetical protein QNJ72_25745 [Pleurocapsa sp. MO_226.B13]|nr:hypothetical protein [Pleurocapsa sp. MO_226.B13]